MTTDNLPPLPEDVTWLFGNPSDPMPREHYTADQMREYGELCRQQALWDFKQWAERQAKSDWYGRSISEMVDVFRSMK